MAVPFTTPALKGARARHGPQGRLEILLPNPDREQGLRVLPWEQIRAIGQPSIHDHRLNQHLQVLAQVTPTSVRRVALAVANEGLAGRAVLAAARAAQESGIRAADLLHDRLMADDAGRSADPEALAQVAQMFSPVGLAGQTPAPRVPALLGRLDRMVSELRTCARLGPADRAHQARTIADAAWRTLQLAIVTMRDAQAILAALPRLLHRFETNPGLVGAIAERPLWLLDGWEDIVLLWEDAEVPDRLAAALDEMAQLVPAIPQEIREWVAASVGRSATVIYRRFVPLNEDWRSGVTAMLLPRNERLRACIA